MAATVALLLGLVVLGLLAFVVRFLATLTLLAVGTVLFVAVGAYVFSFLGFYFILGEANIGWAIFGGMLLGTIIVSALLTKAKHVFGKTSPIRSLPPLA